jgi:phosphoglycerol transferase
MSLAIGGGNVRPSRADAAIVTAMTLVVTWVAWRLLGGSLVDWHAPLLYEGDSVLHLLLIKRLWDGHGYLANTAAGYPFGSMFYDFPGSDGMSLVALWLLGKLTDNVALSFNAYYLFGFPAAAVSAYVVLRAESITRVSSVVAAVLFAFAPFHFFRLGHLYYTWYFVIPIFIWYGIRASRATHRVLDRKLFSARRVGHAMALLCLSSFGVYYAFFGCIVIGLSGIFGSFRTRSSRPFQHAAIVGIIIALGVLINITPNILYSAKHGKNDVVAGRFASEAEVHGLKIIQMLLPQGRHRSGKLETIARNYTNNFPLVAENSFASLGLIASIGFLVLLAASILPVRKDDTGRSAFPLLAFLTISLVLIATIGGFSAVFAQYVSPLIRAWNRISIFIAFLSIAGIAYLLDAVGSRSRILLVTAPLLLIVFGLWDQTPKFDLAHLRSMQQSYRDDKAYIDQLQAGLEPASAIYQLPYQRFPEGGSIEKLNSYELGIPYLHSRDLRWSFGTIAGREGDAFFHELSLAPLPVQLEVVRYLGFSGIYIDRRGYADNGFAIEAALNALVHAAPLLNKDGKVAFYSLANIALPTQEQLSTSARLLLLSYGITLKNGQVVVGETSPWLIDFTRSPALQLRAVDGLQPYEPWGVWSRGPAIALRFKHKLPKDLTVTVTVKAFGPNIGKPAVMTINGVEKTFIAHGEFETFKLDFTSNSPTDMIYIKVPDPVAPRDVGVGRDSRVIGLALQQLFVTPR